MYSHRMSLTTLAIVIGMGCVIFLIVCLLAIDFLFGTGILLPPRVLPARPESHLEMARSRVQIGDERNSAIETLSDAWFHTECKRAGSTVVQDLFFYGPHDRDQVKIVLVESKMIDNETSVVFVGLVENYMLHLYDYCTPPLPQVFSEDTPTITTTP